MSKHKVAVAYLVWLPFGVELFSKFINSYCSKSAGADHTLLLLFNGVENENDIVKYLEIVAQNNIDVDYLISETGQDMEIYQWCCGKVNYEIILFLNSYSLFNKSNWLFYYLNNFKDDVGMIGASASNQSIYSTALYYNKLKYEKGKNFMHHFKKIKMFFKAILYWRYFFKPFPTPHIRATAFMLRRSDYLQMHFKYPLLKKVDAYKIECGKHSMTNWFLQRNLKVGVVNSDGIFYDLKNAINSNTFRINNQEKLLISDKQTDWYDNSDKKQRREFTYLAWGD
jgi:hypothetical protein